MATKITRFDPSFLIPSKYIFLVIFSLFKAGAYPDIALKLSAQPSADSDSHMVIIKTTHGITWNPSLCISIKALNCSADRLAQTPPRSKRQGPLLLKTADCVHFYNQLLLTTQLCMINPACPDGRLRWGMYITRCRSLSAKIALARSVLEPPDSAFRSQFFHLPYCRL